MIREPTMSEHSPSPNHSSTFTASLPASPLVASSQRKSKRVKTHSPPTLRRRDSSSFSFFVHFLVQQFLHHLVFARFEGRYPVSRYVGYSRIQLLGHRCPLVAETTVAHGTPLRLSHRPKDLYDEEAPDPGLARPQLVALALKIKNKHNPSLYLSILQIRTWISLMSIVLVTLMNLTPTTTLRLALPTRTTMISNYSMNTMSSSSSNNHNAMGDPTSADETLTDGMRPFDVLTSIFGSTIAPSELEDALAANGYDLDRTMGWLVNSRAGAAPGGATSTINAQQGQQGPVGPGRMQPMGARVTLVGRGGAAGGIPGRGGMPNTMMVGWNRVVRDSRDSSSSKRLDMPTAAQCLVQIGHDLERTLCHFWLRGTCAKQENCKFLHHLPKDVDMASLNAVLARVNVQPGTGPLAAFMGASHYNDGMGMRQDEFPVLRYDGANDSGV
ncbi:hypothetical protein D9613_012141 [Agrocybe pediades]|uniref:C3H1-type domain-containing protein n=1 Tax=Agrocybe pediades TaxID=84607 RepID=A0A8H4VTP4_9AGAR|nr:hypothetical protein D9613_012141 [Agrocybe pediades]